MELRKVYDELNARIDKVEREAQSGGGGGSTVSVEAVVESGTKIATITVDEEDTDLFAPSVSVEAVVESGTKIATITVGDTETDIFTPATETKTPARVVGGGIYKTASPTDIRSYTFNSIVGRAYAIIVFLQTGTDISTLMDLDVPSENVIASEALTVDANHHGHLFIIEASSTSTAIAVSDSYTLGGKDGVLVVDLGVTPAGIDATHIYKETLKDGDAKTQGSDMLRTADIALAACIDGANWDHSIIELANTSSFNFGISSVGIIKGALNDNVGDLNKLCYMKLTQSYAQGAFIGLFYATT